MNPLVSIIITLYNYDQYIADCLRSCLEQTYDNIEIWVIDDHSTDNSFRIADRFRSEYKNVFLWRHFRNKGIGASKNTGIMNSKGMYITFLDADDMLTKRSIELRVKAMEKHNLDMVHGYAYKIGPNNYLETSRRMRKKLLLSGKPESINAQTTMYDREVFEKFGMFYEPRDLHSKEDTEMAYRLGIHYNTTLPKRIKTLKLPKKKPLAFHRHHDKSAKNSRSNNIKLNRAFINRIKVLQKEGITQQNTKFL